MKTEEKLDLVQIQLNNGELHTILMHVKKILADKIGDIMNREPEENWANKGFDLLDKAFRELEQEKGELWYMAEENTKF